jgi:hypothetical protein
LKDIVDSYEQSLSKDNAAYPQVQIDSLQVRDDDLFTTCIADANFKATITRQSLRIDDLEKENKACLCTIAHYIHIILSFSWSS